jgi:hypothetical protein
VPNFVLGGLALGLVDVTLDATLLISQRWLCAFDPRPVAAGFSRFRGI